MFANHTILFVGISPHTQQLIHQYQGTIVRDPLQANCVVVSQSYQLTANDRSLLAAQHLRGLPIYTDQYIIDAVRFNGNIDATKYRISFVSPTSSPPTSQNLIASVEMKGSRDVDFSSKLPKILYTLTWKHKYDVRITTHRNIFIGKPDLIKSNLRMCLVLGSSYHIPKYEGNGRGGKKNSDTIMMSSVQKVSESEIIIRFGIHSTYCSKRFGYEPFRLCISFTPTDASTDSQPPAFTVYTSEFKTFVKKNANISKYLESPIDDELKLITPTSNPENLPMKPERQNTIDLPTTAKQPKDSLHDAQKSSASANSKKRKRKPSENSKSKKKKKEPSPALSQPSAAPAVPSPATTASHSTTPLTSASHLLTPDTSALSSHSHTQPEMVHNYANPTLSVSAPPTSAGFNSYTYPPEPPPSAGDSDSIKWFGEPMGMNVNGDLFYLAFWKDGRIYKVNDFVYLCPDSQNYSDINWICKIINLVQTTAGEMKLVGQWYYKWCDVEGIVNDEKSVLQLKTEVPGPVNQHLVQQVHNKHHSKEVFASFDMTYNPLAQIKAKCHVAWMGTLDQEWIQKADHYFFYFGFNRTSKQLIMLDDQTIRELRESTNSDIEPNPYELQKELLTLQSEIKGHQQQQTNVFSNGAPSTGPSSINNGISTDGGSDLGFGSESSDPQQHMRILSLTRRPSWEGTIGEGYASSSSSLSGTPHQGNGLSSLPSMGFPSLTSPHYPHQHEYPSASPRYSAM